jgi:hypothetical protein
MQKLTKDQLQAIEAKVQSMTLCAGVGTTESACSVAAINLALTGILSDDIPDCMSRVIGIWIIAIQDSISPEIRNSCQWKALLPLAAGTGRGKEKERLDLILDWMWNKALLAVQPAADKSFFGDEWRTMLEEKTADSCRDASRAASISAQTVTGTYIVATTASAAADEAILAISTESSRSQRAAYAVNAAVAAVGATPRATYERDWSQIDPCGTLHRLIEVV